MSSGIVPSDRKSKGSRIAIVYDHPDAIYIENSQFPTSHLLIALTEFSFPRHL